MRVFDDSGSRHAVRRLSALLGSALIFLLASSQGARGDAGEAPALRILSPADGEIVPRQEITLRVALRRNPQASAIQLRIFVDGKLLHEQRGFSVSAAEPASVTPDETVETLP